MTDQKDRAQLSNDLEALRYGRLSGEAFYGKYQRDDIPEVVEWIWANIHHYLSDEDIRAKDPAYRTMQDAELDRMIRLVREGGTEQQLRSITFLWSSEA